MQGLLNYRLPAPTLLAACTTEEGQIVAYDGLFSLGLKCSMAKPKGMLHSVLLLLTTLNDFVRRANLCLLLKQNEQCLLTAVEAIS